MQTYLIGLMSGTSCDGIDVAIIHADTKKLHGFQTYALPAQTQESVLRLAEPSMDEIDLLGHLDQTLGEAFAQAALDCMAEYSVAASSVLLIGNHGQTIRHRPHRMDGGRPFTLQIGCPAHIAERTGVTVVSDFRRRDIVAGGEGAPLTPWAHQRLFSRTDSNTAVLNIGGIANITWLGKDGSVRGFDTGPGNMLMDAIMLHLSDGRHRYDDNGEMATIGTVCEPLLKELLRLPYFSEKPPKSTGRELFGQAMLERLLTWPELDDASRLSTASMLTVRSITESVRFLPAPPDQWLLCGGGVHNSYLMQSLRQALCPARVDSTESQGYPADAIEAISFALLAENTLIGQHNVHPDVTGAKHATCGGQITPGNNWSQLMGHSNQLINSFQ